MPINPYRDLTFFPFILKFFSRLLLFFSGNLSLHQLATDEIQILVLSGIGISSAIVGSFLVLRKMTMLANSLSHTLLIGIVIAYLFFGGQGSNQSLPPMQAMLVASLAVGFLTAFLTEFLTKSMLLQEDASMGLVFTTLFAIGIILVTVLTRDAHIGIEAVMGNVDALNIEDLKWVYLVAFLNLFIYGIFTKELTLISFDSELGRALGFSTVFFNYLLMSQVSITSITAFRAVGVLLVLAFMTAPPLIARLLSFSLRAMIIKAVIVASFASLMGVAISRHLLTTYDIALSTGSIVVTLLLIFYLLLLLISPHHGIFSLFFKKFTSEKITDNQKMV